MVDGTLRSAEGVAGIEHSFAPDRCARDPTGTKANVIDLPAYVGNARTIEK
jgi:hypothetical protein